MSDPQTWTQGFGEAIAAAMAGSAGVVAGLLRMRGIRPEVARISDVAQAAILRAALVEKGMSDISHRLDRIEGKLDRLWERG